VWSGFGALTIALPFDGHAIRQTDLEQTLVRHIALIRQQLELRQQRIETARGATEW